MLGAPKAQAKQFAIFQHAERNIIGIVGASAIGASEHFVDFANRCQCAQQKLRGWGMTEAKAKLGGHGIRWPQCSYATDPK